jgi:predicted small metal-binding protein
MARKVSDCRETPSEKNCSLTIAGEEGEVLDAAVMHAVAAHGHQDTPALRAELKAGLKDEA